MGKVYSMVIKYLDSKRIQTSPNPSKSWEFADGKATGSFQLLPAGTSAFTLMVWVKFKDVSSNHEILRSGNANDSIEIWTNTSGLYLTSSSWNGADSSTQLVTASNLSTTAWTHIAICRDGSERDFIYINGEPASNFPSGRSKSVPTISDWHIGGRHDDTEDFDGDISQWLVYTDFKSQVEVQAVYNYGSGTLTPSTTNLQTHYNFAQTGSTLTDQQGSNNCTASGTIVKNKSGFGDVQAKPISKEVVLSRQGNDGGIGVRNFSGSGGGGSATAGFVNGGDGTANDITGASPTPYYAGGGGGGNGQNFNSGGTGGSSIGGNGGYNSVGANATANRGSGGGGGGNNSSVGYAGGNGSDGVVIIRYATADGTATTSGSVTSDTSISGQTILTYTGTGTFAPTSSFNVQYLVIGGGGSGGNRQHGGGGGAGGFRTSTSYAVTAQSYDIEVGAGGASPVGSGNTNGGSGDSSSFGTIISLGGGRGGTYNSDGANGGSGGGSGGSSGTKVGGTGTTTSSDVTPTSVQDNSILVEKDTGRRYWFDAESNATVTKDYPMTTDPRTNTFNTSGVTTITHANSTLQLNQMNSSSSMGASTYIDLGSDLSTKWVMRFRTNQSGYTNYAYNSQMQVGMSSVAPTSTAYNISSSLNWIGFRWYFGTQFSATYQGIEPRIGQNTGDNTHNNSTARLYGNPNNTTNTGTSYYHEFIWNVDTFTYNLYDNANYTGTKLATAIMSSSTNTNWVTGTPSSVSGLRYLVFKIGADSQGGLWVNQLDDVKIYDGVTSVTTPATWTMEPTFEDDFTSYADQTAADLAWVSQETASTRVNVTNDNLAFSVTGTSNKGISYDLGVGNVSDTTWILQYTLAHTTYTNGSGYGQYWIGLSSADSATLYGGAQDSISSRYNRDTAMRVEASDNSDMGNQGGTDGVDLANNTTYYVDLIRDGTSITRNIYTDSARTGTIFSTSTLTISGTITGLRYFVLRNDSASGTSGHATGTIDDIKFYNGVTTPN